MIAIKLYGENLDGIPSVWPKEIRRGIDALPSGFDLALEGEEALADYKAQHQTAYDAWLAARQSHLHPAWLHERKEEIKAECQRRIVLLCDGDPQDTNMPPRWQIRQMNLTAKFSKLQYIKSIRPLTEEESQQESQLFDLFEAIEYLRTRSDEIEARYEQGEVFDFRADMEWSVD